MNPQDEPNTDPRAPVPSPVDDSRTRRDAGKPVAEEGKPRNDGGTFNPMPPSLGGMS